jgi:hypothetical protein
MPPPRTIGQRHPRRHPELSERHRCDRGRRRHPRDRICKRYVVVCVTVGRDDYTTHAGCADCPSRAAGCAGCVLLCNSHNLTRTSPRTCHNLTRTSPRTCHNLTLTRPRTCHNLTQTLPWTCHNLTQTLPWTCHNLTQTLPRTCHNLTGNLLES